MSTRRPPRGARNPPRSSAPSDAATRGGHPSAPDAAGEAAGRSVRSRLAFAAAALAALGLLVFAYANSLRNQFHFDDHSVLVENLYLRNLDNVPRFFVDASTYTTFPPNAVYRPLVSTTLAVDHHLAGGLDPYVFRISQLVQMALLWLALLAFYRLVMERAQPAPVNRWLALFAATLFGVHTLNSEAMNLMHVRSEILSTLGLVVGFVVWLHGGLPRRLGLHYLAMVVGALAKLPAVTLGPLVMLWSALDNRWGPVSIQARAGSIASRSGVVNMDGARGVSPAARPWMDAVRHGVRAGIGLLLVGAATAFAISRLDAPTQHYAGGDRLPYALTQVWAWLHYVRLAILPLGLSADPDSARIQQWYDSRVFAGALALLALLWLFVRTARSRRAWPIAFGLGWWAIGLAPASSILPISETMNDHRPFVGLIGLILAAVWAARLAWEVVVERSGRRGELASRGPRLWRAVATVTCLGILAGHVAGARARNEVWRDDLTLWTDVTTKSPGNGRGWMNYGLALMQRGRLDEAAAAYARSEALLPNYYVLRINQAILAGARGDVGAAGEHFQQAIRLGPTMPDPYHYYARWLVDQGRGAEALAQLAEAQRVTPGYAPAVDLAMDLEVARGNWDAAARLAAGRLALDPSDARAAAYARRSAGQQGEHDLLVHQARVLGQQRQFVASALAYRAALEQQPHSAEALNNLGWTLGMLGFYPEAAAALQQALVAQPDFALARNNLAWVGDKARTARR
jgi:Tfp pilus assembly protein PilF